MRSIVAESFNTEGFWSASRAFLMISLMVFWVGCSKSETDKVRDAAQKGDVAAQKVLAGQSPDNTSATNDLQQKSAAIPPPAVDSGGSAAATSASAWADQFFNAPYLSEQQILKQVGSVRLVIKPNSDMTAMVSMDDLKRTATEVCSEYGLRIDALSPFTLTLEAQLTHQGFDTVALDDDNKVTHTFKVFQLYTSVAISTATVCYQGGEFVPVEAKVVWWYGISGAAEGTDFAGQAAMDYFGQQYKAALEDRFKSVSTDDAQQAPQTTQDWQNTRWPASRDSEMFAACLRAVQEGAQDTQRMFKGIHSVRLGVNFNIPVGLDANDVASQWTQALQNDNITIVSTGPIQINYQVVAAQSDMNKSSGWLGFHEPDQQYFDDMEEISVTHDSVPILIGGKVYRACGFIWEGHHFAMALVNDNPGTLKNLLSRDMDDFIQEASYRR